MGNSEMKAVLRKFICGCIWGQYFTFVWVYFVSRHISNIIVARAALTEMEGSERFSKRSSACRETSCSDPHVVTVLILGFQQSTRARGSIMIANNRGFKMSTGTEVSWLGVLMHTDTCIAILSNWWSWHQSQITPGSGKGISTQVGQMLY